MKKIFLFLLPVCFIACQKKNVSMSSTNPIITQAQTFFTGVLSQHLPVNSANFRANQARVADWDRAEVKNLSVGMAVIVPVTFQKKLFLTTDLANSYLLDISRVTKLVIFLDASGQYRYQVLTLIPDSSAIQRPTSFTGVVLSEDWSGNTVVSPQRIGPPLMASGSSPRPVIPDLAEYTVTACTEIDGYNYSPDDPDDGEAWEETTCTTYELGDGDAGSSGMSSGDYSAVGVSSGGAGATSVKIEPPTSLIASVANYFQCFTNVGGSDHTYTVTLAINQPVPGTRKAWTLTSGGPSGTTQANNVVNVGHTFLILTESYGNTTITRNIGFYPSTFVWPPSPSSPGAFGDDETDEYNVSASFTLNNAQFFDIVNYITSANSSSYLYNLNSNNCSTFAINALAQAGINLPRTIGDWPGGSGCDPGDLGEDILAGNIPNISLNTNPPVNHSNVGQCN